MLAGGQVNALLSLSTSPLVFVYASRGRVLPQKYSILMATITLWHPTSMPEAPQRLHGVRTSLGAVVGLACSWLGLVIFFSICSPVFFTPFNLQNILANMATLTIIAIGQTFVIISGGIDLSAGYVMGMVSVVAALDHEPLCRPRRRSGWSCWAARWWALSRLDCRPGQRPADRPPQRAALYRHTGHVWHCPRCRLFALRRHAGAGLRRRLGRLGNGYLALFPPDGGLVILSRRRPALRRPTCARCWASFPSSCCSCLCC